MSKRLAFLATAVALALVVVACAPQAQKAPEEPRWLRLTAAWPLHIDPAVGNDFISSTALVNLYDTLVWPTPDGKVIPHVAESWTVSDDNLRYTFKLKRGIKFHDGRTLTSSDVKFSFERLTTIGEGFAYLFKDKVAAVETPDPHTVVFRLKKPFGPFLNILARLYIVNEQLVRANLKPGKYGDLGDYGKEYLNTHDAGSGAYKVKEFDVGSYIVLERFPDYFAKVAPNAPDFVKITGTTEAVSVRTWMAQRELEISDQWQTTENFKSLDQIKGVDIAHIPDGAMLYLMLHTKKPPLDDVHVRRGLSWAFDYDTVVRDIFPGTQQARGPVARILPGHNPNVFQYHFDLKRAAAELRKSKYYGQLDRYPIEYAWTAEVPDLEKIALMLQANAAKIGLKINIVKTPWLNMIDRAAKLKTTPHIASIWVAPHYGEAGSILESRYHSANVGTWEQTEWLQDPEVDRMINQALATVDFTQRMRLYGQIQEKIVDLVPSIFVFDNVSRHAYQAAYVGWPQAKEPHPVMGYTLAFRFIQVYPEKRAALLGK